MQTLLQQDHNLTEREFQQISDLVYKHCRINLHDGKKELVRARIAKRMRVGGFANASQYLDHVLADADGEEFTQLIDAISTNLTSFFRERNHFDYLSEAFLPNLMQRKRKRQTNRIRAWSAGCSSGEEPYTLAMVLADTIDGDATGGWDVKLLATDISTRVLAMAKAGVYDKARADSVPPQQRNRYLQGVRHENRQMVQVSDALKQMISFRHLNLMEPWPFRGPFDFIFCRNVMIYFDKPTQERLVNRYWECLDDGGLLFTGHSESLTGINHKFKYVQPTIYAKA